MNKVILIGRLTRDPELRKTPTDISVVQFTLAVNRSFQNRDGERQADFISCVAWRNQAENLSKYIKKGGQIAVEGNLQTRSYDDASGQKRFVTEVVCEQIHFIEPKKTDSSYYDVSQLDVPPTRSNNQKQTVDNTSQNNPFDDINKDYDISSDDLPF